MRAREGRQVNRDTGRHVHRDTDTHVSLSPRHLVYVFTCLLAFLPACLPLTRPVVKIALVAPFEGRYRNVGYEVIYAVRLAVREANANGGVAGYSIELMAFDDAGNVDAAVEQARKVVADPQVLGVIEHWRGATTTAAATEYDLAGLPLLATGYATDLPNTAFQLWLPESPCAQTPTALCPESAEELRLLEAEGLLNDESQLVYLPAPLPADSTDPTFAERYRAISNGVEPSFNAVLAYDAAQVLFAAIARAVEINGPPTRAGLLEALAQSEHMGLSGLIQFDSQHQWAEPQAWSYQWNPQGLTRP